MNLAKMWEVAERGEGKTLKRAIEDMNQATGRHYAYKSHVWEWLKGRKPVPLTARGYMVKVALPTILKCVAVKLRPDSLQQLEEMLR